MKHESIARHLDVAAFAQSAGEIAGHDLLSKYERLMQETQGQGSDRILNWSARGEWRMDEAGGGQVWLHLVVDTCLPLICQRCMGPADIAVAAKRSFRFVASEEEALAQDDESEEDVLVLSKDFNLTELIEDEVLMDLPVVARHVVCPVAVKLAVADASFDTALAEQRHPFAALAKLRGRNSG